MSSGIETTVQEAPPAWLLEALAGLQVPDAMALAQQMQRRWPQLTPEGLLLLGRSIVSPAQAAAWWRAARPEVAAWADDPDHVARWHAFVADALTLGLRWPRLSASAAAWAEPPSEALLRDTLETLADEVAQARLQLLLPPAMLAAMQAADDPGETQWPAVLQTVRSALFYEWGLVLAPPRLVADSTLAAGTCRVQWNDWRLPPRPCLMPGEWLTSESPERLRIVGLQGEAFSHPYNGQQHARIDASGAQTLREAGGTVNSWREVLGQQVAAGMRSALPALATRGLWRWQIERLREHHDELVQQARRELDADQAVRVMRALLAEGVSVRPLPQIVQALLELRGFVAVDTQRCIVFEPVCSTFLPTRQAPAAVDVEHLTQFVRVRLAAPITRRATGGQNTLSVYLLHPTIEERLSQAEALDEGEASLLAQAVLSETGSVSASAQAPVLLTTADVRARLRHIITPWAPKLHVLAYQELTPETNIQPIARVSMGAD